MKLLVKALWTVGYDDKTYTGGEKFECDEGWGRRKAAQGKVEIIEEIPEEDEGDDGDGSEEETGQTPSKKETDIDITELTVKEAKDTLEDIDDPALIETLLEQEEEREEPRITLIDALGVRLRELEE